MENWRDMKRCVAMVIACMCLFGASAAPTVVQGTFVSLDTDSAGAHVTITSADGKQLAFLARSDATVRERAAGGQWQTIALTDLKEEEPIAVTLGPDGQIAGIDAEYVPIATQFVLVKNGYGIATSGAVYKLVGAAARAGAQLGSGTYVYMRTDPQTKAAFDLVASAVPLTATGERARAVAVTLIAHVPPNTPPNDVVYIATNAQSWTPNAVRMSPLPGNRWTVTLTLLGGTQLQYKYTRGSWPSDERDAAGTEIANRTLTVSNDKDTQTLDDMIVRWADLPS
jgi:hypothetical protein